LKPLYAFMDWVVILPINEAVVDKTISLRQKYRIGLGDAIIAATALVNNLVLITRNIKDFEIIDALSLVNPFEL
jgi:predicted nucleic acid-binding protein